MISQLARGLWHHDHVEQQQLGVASGKDMGLWWKFITFITPSSQQSASASSHAGLLFFRLSWQVPRQGYYYNWKRRVIGNNCMVLNNAKLPFSDETFRRITAPSPSGPTGLWCFLSNTLESSSSLLWVIGSFNTGSKAQPTRQQQSVEDEHTPLKELPCLGIKTVKL